MIVQKIDNVISFVVKVEWLLLNGNKWLYIAKHNKLLCKSGVTDATNSPTTHKTSIDSNTPNRGLPRHKEPLTTLILTWTKITARY